MPTIRHALSLAPLALLLLAGTAQAAGSRASAEHRYEQDRQACLSGDTWQDRQTCLREAGAARQAARRGKLSSGTQDRLTDNALARCEVFKDPTDQAACVARVEGPAASGSVPEGGLLRESVITTITPAEPARP